MYWFICLAGKLGAKDGEVGSWEVWVVSTGRIPRRVQKGKPRQCKDSLLLVMTFLIAAVVFFQIRR